MLPVNSRKPRKLSIFFHIVKQALIAFPNDAHLHILHFLDQKGLSKEDQETFKDAWSKVILANQSFGKAGSQRDPDMIAKEVLEELYNGTELREDLRFTLQQNVDALQALEDHKFESTFSPKDVEFFDSIVSTFRVTAENIREVNKKLFALPSTFLALSMEEDDFDLQNMMACQDAVEKFRLVTRKGELRRYSYNPIDPYVLFKHSYKTGKLVSKSDNKSKQAPLPQSLSTDEFLGLDVKFDMSSGLRDSWTTWSFLFHFLSCRSFNMFPKPLDVIDYPNPPSQMFCFENCHVRPFLDYLHPIFVEALLDHPGVVAFWCQQLAVTARALHSSEGKLYTGLKLEDLLVTDDGFLLQHRIGFVEIEEEDDYCGSNYTNHKNFEYFIPYIYRVLGAALGTSRKEAYEVPEVAAFRVTGYALQNTETSFQHMRNCEAVFYRNLQREDDNLLNEAVERDLNSDDYLSGNRGDDNDGMDDEYIDDVIQSASAATASATLSDNSDHDYLYEQYPTYTILAGSHLTFQLYCGEVFGATIYDYLRVYGPLADTIIDYNVSYNVLHVVKKIEDLEDSSDSNDDSPTVIASIADRDDDLHYANVVVQTKKPCKCYLELSSAVLDAKDPTKIERRFACIRIVVIPDRPAKSLFVQEVMEYLEMYYFLGIPTTIFSATLFEKSRELLKDAEQSNEVLLQCSRDWIVIKKILKDHGLLPNPTIRPQGKS